MMLISIAAILSGNSDKTNHQVNINKIAEADKMAKNLPVYQATEIKEKTKIEDVIPQKEIKENPVLTQKSKVSEREINCLASAIHYEARGEIKEGQIAVAEVVLTRAKSKIYPNNVCDVISQRAQFSFVRRGNIPNVPQKDIEKRKDIARKVVSGELQSRVKGAMYFHAKNIAPSWRRQMSRLAQIGGHVFYKRKRASE